MPSPREKPDLHAKLRDVPHQPGVYIMRDRLHRVIYVGKARDLRKRLSNYFQPSRLRKVDIKTRALIESIWEFDLQIVKNEAEALLLEGRLIKEFRPRYNVSFKDDKRFLLVRVHMGDPVPRFSMTRLKKDDGSRYFGPYVHPAALRMTINWLNKRFGLRVCRPLRPDEADYKHCSNDIIKNCSAPCVARISAEDYKARMEQACEFLEGKSKDLIAGLEEEMQAAAKRFDFEKAAEMRDMVADMRQTIKPTRTFERGAVARAVSTLDPMADVRELQEELRLERQPLVMECFDIANLGSAYCVASMVRFRNGVPDNANYRRYRIKIVSGQNDFAAMAEVIRRRYSRILLQARGSEVAEFSQEEAVEVMRRMEVLRAQFSVLSPDDAAHGTSTEHSALSTEHLSHEAGKPSAFVTLPDLIIVDGGKGQLSSAMAELQRLGLHELPIIGLAKENEEIYRPGESAPLVLSHELGALKLLQRIRDEAHRWANGYHQLLLRRRVAESILDDCPGVSENRKQALLKKFGSVTRLRKVTAEKIATVPGIGKVLAEEIARYLHEH